MLATVNCFTRPPKPRTPTCIFQTQNKWCQLARLPLGGDVHILHGKQAQVFRVEDIYASLLSQPSDSVSTEKLPKEQSHRTFEPQSRCSSEQGFLSHVARPQGSRIKSFSCSQATGFQNPPMSCSQVTGFHNLTSVMLPDQWFTESNLNHVPRTQGSRIKPMSSSQTMGFHLGHSYVSSAQGTTIKPQSYS